VERETIELVYVAALQVLPPRQRALVVLRYVLGWSAADTARALGLTVTATNSALQRARGRLRAHLPADRREWGTGPTAPDAADAAVLRGFMDACERYDVEAMVALASDGIRLTAPPDPRTWDGREAYAAETAEGFGPGAPGVLRCLPTRANRRPAAAIYLRRWGDDAFRPFALSVLRGEGGELVEVTAFSMADFDRWALPRTVPT
jgi:RNA polymerase sigma-70 factor, ECF subfamily